MNKLPSLNKFLSCSTKLTFLGRTMSNYFINYPLYCSERENRIASNFEKQNLQYYYDLQEIKNTQKKIASKDRKFIESSDRSYLTRQLQFNSREECVQFINVIKNNLNELDHHPEWNIEDKILNINLTSHFLKNKVSDLDWQVAALISQKYDDRFFNKYALNQKSQTLISYSAGLLFVLFSLYCVSKFYYLQKNYNISSRDFLFQKVLTARNDYNNERKYRNF